MSGDAFFVSLHAVFFLCEVFRDHVGARQHLTDIFHDSEYVLCACACVLYIDLLNGCLMKTVLMRLSVRSCMFVSTSTIPLLFATSSILGKCIFKYLEFFTHKTSYKKNNACGLFFCATQISC